MAMPDDPDERPHDPADELDDRFVLRPDGQVWIYFEGRPEPVRCRRPKLRDDSAMWEMYLAVADDLGDWAEANRRFIVEQNDRIVAEARVETDEERAEGRKRRSEFQHGSEARWLGWWKALVERMAPEGSWLAEDGDAPLWMVQSASAAQVINHWRTMPVPSLPR